MELDTVMQIVFGIFTISIAVFGIWFAWHNTRGMSLHLLLGSYPRGPTLDPPLTPHEPETPYCPATMIILHPKVDTSGPSDTRRLFGTRSDTLLQQITARM
jgi:hypothetical protein